MTSHTNTYSRENTMDLQALNTLIPLLIAGLTTLGGAVVWIFNRMDSKSLQAKAFEKEERAKLEKLLQEQIKALQDEVHTQNTEIIQLRRELNTYVRHVGVLEGLLKSQGVEPPPLQVIPA